MVIEAQAVVYMLKYLTLTRFADIGFYFVPTSKCLSNITAVVFSIYYDSAGPKVCQLVLSFLRSTIIHKFQRISLTCVLRAHDSIPFLEKKLSGIEKVLTTFTIPDKFFPKTDLLLDPFSKDLTNFTKIYTLCHMDSFNMSDLIMLDMNQHQLWWVLFWDILRSPIKEEKKHSNLTRSSPGQLFWD